MSQNASFRTPIGQIRSPWGVWWLSMITVGIYYLVWYVKINKEVARAAGADIQVKTFGLWFSQCVPIAAWISLAHTAERIATAQHRNGTAPTASAGMTILSSLWFGSNVRYLQRRANQLWRYLEVQQGVPTAAALPVQASTPAVDVAIEAAPTLAHVDDAQA